MATLLAACFSSSPSVPPGSRRGVGYKISLLDQAKEWGTVSRACHSAYRGPGPSGDVGVDRCPLLWLGSTGQEAEGLGAWRFRGETVFGSASEHGFTKHGQG